MKTNESEDILENNEILCTQLMETCPQHSHNNDYRPQVFARILKAV